MKPFNLTEAKSGEPIFWAKNPVTFIAHVPEAKSNFRVVYLDHHGNVSTAAEDGNIPCHVPLTMGPRIRFGWVNIYPSVTGRHMATMSPIYETKEQADQQCPVQTRIACIRIEWEEE